MIATISSSGVHQIRFRWGLRPGPAGEEYSAPRNPLAGLRGPTSKETGGEGNNKGKRQGRE